MVTRDQGISDDTWNDTTGTYTDSGDLIVYQGPASISARGSSPAQTAEAGQMTIVSVLTLNIPLESDKLMPDDFVTVLASMRNPHLIDETFIVKSQRTTSYAVQQSVLLERHEGQRPR